MNRRLILLDYQRLCVWNTGATNIKTAREIIKKSLPSKKTALSIRRILQWNGNTRIDFWTPRSDSSLLINHIITSNPSWRAKEYVPFRLRRPTPCQDRESINKNSSKFSPSTPKVSARSATPSLNTSKKAPSTLLSSKKPT